MVKMRQMLPEKTSPAKRCKMQLFPTPKNTAKQSEEQELPSQLSGF